MKASTATRRMFERDPSSDMFVSVDQFNLQARSAEDKGNDGEQTTKKPTLDIREEGVCSFDVDVSRRGYSAEVALMKKTSDITKQSDQSTSRTFFVKRSDQSPRSDIGLRVKMRRSPQERSLSKQSQFKNGPTPVSGRRMSSPGKLFNGSLSEQNSASTRIVTASERKTNRFTQVDHFFDAKNESRDPLPKITKSLETLKTGDQSRRSKSSEDVRNGGKTTSKWSPQSFNSDKSTDRSQGLLDSKIIAESRLTTPQTLVSEGFSDCVNKTARKNKVNVQFSRLDTKQQNTALSRPFGDFQIDSDDSSGQRKARISKRGNRGIDLVLSSGSTEEFKATTGDRMKRQTVQSKVTISTHVRTDRRPRSKIPFRRNETATSEKPYSASNPEHELDLRVKAFLRRHQPTAGPRTLKVKAVKRKPGSANKLRERRSQERITVNTDTCPSSYRVNQDRSWYYQDKKGKCRYLRVPESPVPPIEWVFERTPSP